jgi:alkanesulfonate monooxygenase SsuD/methylene tetrahydromethanopterin reductase-like flavin-dependent oxidoreductase (luciferase family)
MRYGFVLPWGDARTAAELASLAERSGWDGFFVWEPVWGIDAWVALAAAAMRTERIRLGTMLTPLPRRKPWDVASQAATLDNLSGGRVILSVGLGAVHEGWLAFEADPGRRVRAELLDEGLDVLTGLWAGESFAYTGRHYTVQPTEFMLPPPPVQRPRVPIWVVGLWPAPRSMRRAARWDGWLPNFRTSDPTALNRPNEAQFAAAIDWLRAERSAHGLAMEGHDAVMEGTTPADDPIAAKAIVGRWADAGATWWLEADWSVDRERVREYAEGRLSAGPPR